MYSIATKIQDPPDWQQNRVKAMETLIRDKFRRHRELKEKLIQTGTRELVNTFADLTTSNIFWGVVDGKGQNQVGRIIEQVRADIQTNLDLARWLYSSFTLQEDYSLHPQLKLNVIKNNEIIETLPLQNKPFFMMGKLSTCEICMAHNSISRHHAVIIVDQNLGVCLIDVGSKSGSFVNQQKLGENLPFKLQNGDKLNFAISTRSYEIVINYQQVQINLEIKKQKIEKDLRIMQLLDKISDPSITKQKLIACLGVPIEDTLYIANLPLNTSERKIYKLFSQFGKINDIRMPIDKASGKLKGFAFLTFSKETESRKALQQSDRLEIDGKRLRVSLAENRNDNQLLEKLEKAERTDALKSLKEYEQRAQKDLDTRFGSKIKQKIDKKIQDNHDKIKQEKFASVEINQPQQQQLIEEEKKKDKIAEHHKQRKDKKKSRSRSKEKKIIKKKSSSKKKREASSSSSSSSSSGNSSSNSSSNSSRSSSKDQKNTKKIQKKDSSNKKKQESSESSDSDEDSSSDSSDKSSSLSQKSSDSRKKKLQKEKEKLKAKLQLKQEEKMKAKKQHHHHHHRRH
eukprot:TRINITY_DN14137_c0_g1_i7.p2 TRINITY_DN14137_c0_g1~~TRINITY_DN14137_c0_g1_i7.p2  ORF type:complete len:570 (+),score=85.50 TRINITY_DN14137_c0_g1_i7:393-2102(+)